MLQEWLEDASFDASSLMVSGLGSVTWYWPYYQSYMGCVTVDNNNIYIYVHFVAFRCHLFMFGCQTWFLVTAARPLFWWNLAVLGVRHDSWSQLPGPCFDRTSLFWVSDIIPGHSCPALFLIQPRCWIAGGPGWFVHNSRPATVVYP